MHQIASDNLHDGSKQALLLCDDGLQLAYKRLTIAI